MLHKLQAIIIILTIVGMAASIGSYLAYKEGLACTPEDSPSTPLGDNGLGTPPASIGLPSMESGGLFECQRVYSVRGARVLGLHFSELAPIYFSILLALSILSLHRPIKGLTLKTQLALYIVGVLTLPYLWFLEYKANALCTYCTIMHAIIILNLIILIKIMKI
ncbi:MAG: hypothetical protein F7C35_01515 [Desulfurococcales archaeon]|nr:hypothetical protein [Desulfurococcales archaeon]